MTLTALPRRLSASSAAEHCLRQAILSGDIGPGDKLPPERELSVTLGISRLTLRAALASLTSSGLLEVTQGSGYRARDFRSVGGPDLIPGLLELITHRRDLVAIAGDLLRVRRHLARAVLECLQEAPPSPARIAAFRERVDRLATAVASSEDLERLAAIDLDVIAALVAATERPVLALMHNPIAHVLTGSSDLARSIYRDPMRSVVAWRALADWLEQPSPPAVADFIALLERHDADTLAHLATHRRTSGPRAR